MSDILNNLSENVPGAPIAYDAIMALRDMAFEASSAPIKAECLPALEALVLYAPQLRELSRRALVPNLVHDASILAPALKLLDDQTLNLEIILAWQPMGDTSEKNAPHKRLVGWLVVHRARALPGIGFSYLKNWHHLYSYMGHPIVDRDNAKAALSALFDQALAHPRASGRLMMSNVPGEGPIYDAISSVIGDKNLLAREFGRHQRAAMITDLGGEEYLKSALSNKKRKEFRRLKNRLVECGDLKFETCRAADDSAAWVEDFINLESSGWKGRKQTAFGNRHNWAAFMKASTLNLVENEHCKIWRLTLNDKTIAITIAHHVEHCAWLTKIAYDEAFAKYSPGVLLILEVTKAFADDRVITQVDSLAAPDHPMINRLWRQRVSTTDILIANNHRVARMGFAATCQLITARRFFRAKAKSIYYRFLKGAKR